MFLAPLLTPNRFLFGSAGLFVQSSATYGDSDKAFVDVPSDQFGHFSAEADNSYGYPYQMYVVITCPRECLLVVYCLVNQHRSSLLSLRERD